jgi:monoamine oxidase
LPIQSCWEASPGQGGDAAVLVNLTGGEQAAAVGVGTVGAQRALFVEQLEQVFPGVTQAALRQSARASWQTEAGTGAARAVPLAGQLTAFGGAEGEPEGRVFFCGEHTSARHRGTMNGAAESGARAASEVAEALGLPKVGT